MTNTFKYILGALILISTFSVRTAEQGEESLERFIKRKLNNLTTIQENAKKLISESNRKDLITLKATIPVIKKTLKKELRKQLPKYEATEVMKTNFRKPLKELNRLIADYFKEVYFPGKSDGEIKTDINKQLRQIITDAQKLELGQSSDSLWTQYERIDDQLGHIALYRRSEYHAPYLLDETAEELTRADARAVN